MLVVEQPIEFLQWRLHRLYRAQHGFDPLLHGRELTWRSQRQVRWAGGLYVLRRFGRRGREIVKRGTLRVVRWLNGLLVLIERQACYVGGVFSACRTQVGCYVIPEGPRKPIKRCAQRARVRTAMAAGMMAAAMPAMAVGAMTASMAAAMIAMAFVTTVAIAVGACHMRATMATKAVAAEAMTTKATEAVTAEAVSAAETATTVTTTSTPAALAGVGRGR